MNYLKTKKERQAYFKNRYALSEPKQLAHDRYNKIVLTNILGDAKATREIVRCYKGKDLKMFKRRPTLLKKVVSSVASKKLVNCALAVRKKNAGILISIVKSVTKNTIRVRMILVMDPIVRQVNHTSMTLLMGC